MSEFRHDPESEDNIKLGMYVWAHYNPDNGFEPDDVTLYIPREGQEPEIIGTITSHEAMNLGEWAQKRQARYS